MEVGEVGRHLFSVHAITRQMGNGIVPPCSQSWAWFIHTFPNRVSSICCPGKVQGLLPRVLQLVGFMDSSPALRNTRSALLLVSGIDWGWGGGGTKRLFHYYHWLREIEVDADLT